MAPSCNVTACTRHSSKSGARRSRRPRSEPLAARRNVDAASTPEAKRAEQLERELNRKDKALAEVTELLALKKKLEMLLGDEDESTTPRSAR